MADNITLPSQVPDGMMRVWDAENKQVILVPEPPRPDNLVMSLRLHDPKEKSNAALAASWIIIHIPRSELTLSPEEFAAKHILPRVKELEHFVIRSK